MPSRRLVFPADYKVMPWKNGLGTTTEIAVHPPGAELDAFVWRISLAEIAVSGPFSTFAGVDRIIVQIAGAPMSLVHGDGEEHTLSLLVPYRFRGENATECRVSSGVRDFNVMVRRARATAELAVHVLGAGAEARDDDTDATRVVFVLEGSVSVLIGGASTEVDDGASLIVEGPTRLRLMAGRRGAKAFLVSFASGLR